MKRLFQFFMVTMATFSVTGCARITSQVVEKPRLDQELEGNRGYLAGSAPAEGERRTTRTMIQTDIEMPTAEELNPWKIRKAASVTSPAQPSKVSPSPISTRSTPAEWQEQREEEVYVPVAKGRPAPSAQTYTVKSGDTLEKIAAKFYGNGTQWRRIYKANQDKLKSPSTIYPGQKLIIPSYEREQGRNGSSDIK